MQVDDDDLDRFYEKWVRELDANDQAIRERIPKHTQIIRRLARAAEPRLSDPELVQIRKELDDLLVVRKRLEEKAIERIGLTEEQIEHLEQERRLTEQVEDRLLRTQLDAESIEPTAILEDFLPKALERILSMIDPAWLREEERHRFRLDDTYRRGELSLVFGTRIGNAAVPHRFAQHLLTTRDFLNAHPGYDFWVGALAVPTIAALGVALDSLRLVRGASARLESLHNGHTDLVDSTIYELLVAAACARHGHDVELLATDSTEKTPDIRLHDEPIPFVVECKRRPALFQYERNEARYAQQLFLAAQQEGRRIGTAGLLKVDFTTELKSIAPSTFASDVRRTIKNGPRRHRTALGWGSIAFRELPPKRVIPQTNLYSPHFLQTAFQWNVDVPSCDGLICQVDSPGMLATDTIRHPFGMAWTSSSQAATQKKSRALGALVGKAMKQIPLGEVGALCLCYQEGGTPAVADERTRRILQEFDGWRHHWGIQVPIVRVNRLYPRPLGDGTPDLIENVLKFKSPDVGLEFDSIMPTNVFTQH